VDHHAFIQKTKRYLPVEWIGQPCLSRLVETAGALTGKTLRLYGGHLEFRVVRPHCRDNNPWHRDHWFEYFAPLVNVYLPISGSHCDSSLQIVPFSHLWGDDEVVPTFRAGESKTNRDGILYSVPEVKESARPILGHRMDILPGDFALFSPRMVHGEGTNASPETRFSLEFRLEVAP
jgi:ectoine hydroxylase-related dioxygenase (phytanoyl-CoA dioxygenase family)